MTPIQLLPLTDLANLDTTAFAAAPASPATQKLAAAFAELLHENVLSGQMAVTPIGEELPAGGKLPPVPPATAMPEALDPEAIVASLNRDLENIVEIAELALPASPAIDAPALPLAPTEPGLAAAELLVAVPEAVRSVADLQQQGPRETEVAVTPPINESADLDLQQAPKPLPDVTTHALTTMPPVAAATPQASPAIPATMLREPVTNRLPASPAPATPPVAVQTPRPVLAAEAGPVPIEPGLDALPVPDRPNLLATAEPASLRGDFLSTQQLAAGLQGTAVEPGASSNVAATLNRATAIATPPLQAATASTPVSLGSIDVPVQEAGWDRAMSERIVMMASNRIQNAEIRLTPAELGPIRVQLALDDGVTNVSFSAQHALTRDAIEQAMPRLRELLAETGLTLDQASVGDDSVESGYRDSDDNPDGGVAANNDAVAADGTEDEVLRPARIADGLVDTFV